MKTTIKKIIAPAIMALMCLAACSASTGSKAEGGTEAPADDRAAVPTPKNIEDMVTPPTPTPDSACVKIEMKTTEGDIVLMLYNDTPLHRDNMKKLVEQGFYDGLLFHRVINDFMVQAGDPESKNAAPGRMLGSGDPGYTIPAEIRYPQHYHKRGALAAARTGDQMNPERRSSGSQFYIVTGQKYNADQLNAMAENTALQNYFNSLVEKNRDKIMALQQARDSQGLQQLQQQLQAQTMQWAEENADKLSLPDDVLNAYTTVGGTPHLDDQYTVFGEVISGMDVVDRIQKVETDGRDRPVKDVKIISMKVLSE